MPVKKWPPVPHAHKASGQDRVKYQGRHIYLGPTGSPEAKIAYAELITRLERERRGQPAAPTHKSGLTVAELVEQHSLYAQQRYSVSGREASQFRWACEPLVDLHGDTAVSEFAACHLGEVREEMIRRGWSRKVINRRITRLRTLWRWGEGKGLVPEGRWAALSALAPLDATDARVKKTVPRAAVDWKTLCLVCRQTEPIVRTMLLCQWWTGARPGEVRQMIAGEVDRSGDVWEWRPARHKNDWRGQDRVVMIGPRCQRLLASWLEGKGPREYVFLTRWGRPYSDNTYAQAVKRAAARAGVEGLSPYAMRHSHKRETTRELGLDHARSSLGQASLDATNGYASAQDLDMAKEVARRLG